MPRTAGPSTRPLCQEYQAAAKLKPECAAFRQARRRGPARPAKSGRPPRRIVSSLRRIDSRTDEAATGLELVAKAAERAGDGSALQLAVVTLRGVPRSGSCRATPWASTGAASSSPRRRWRWLRPCSRPRPDAATADSLLVLYAAASRETTACEAAAGAYETVLRRTRDPATPAPRRSSGYGLCAIQLGQEALTVDQSARSRRAGSARRQGSAAAHDRGAGPWLAWATRVSNSETSSVRRSPIRTRSTDPESDSISVLARQRLAALGNAANAKAP